MSFAKRKISLRASAALAVGAVVACSTSSPQVQVAEHAARTSEPVVTATNRNPCPAGMQRFCSFTNLDLSSGAPRESDQCSPAIVFKEHSDGPHDVTSFTWSSPAPGRPDALVFVSAAVVTGGGASQIYSYDPPVSHDDSPLAAPPRADGMATAISDIEFCTKPEAGASTDAGAGAPPPESSDAGSGEANGQTW